MSAARKLPDAMHVTDRGHLDLNSPNPPQVPAPVEHFYHGNKHSQFITKNCEKIIKLRTTSLCVKILLLYCLKQ